MYWKKCGPRHKKCLQTRWYPLVNKHSNGKPPFSNRRNIFKLWISHCYVSLPEGIKNLSGSACWHFSDLFQKCRRNLQVLQGFHILQLGQDFFRSQKNSNTQTSTFDSLDSCLRLQYLFQLCIGTVDKANQVNPAK